METQITKGILSAAIRAMEVASPDVTRWNCMAVRIEPNSNGMVKVVATNGHAMVINSFKSPETKLSAPIYLHRDMQKQARAILKELKKLPDEAPIKLKQEALYLPSSGTSDGYTMEWNCVKLFFHTTSSINYPDYEQVIPKKGDYEISFDAELLAALTSAMTDKKAIIKLNFSGPKSPIRVTSTLDDTCLGIIMPCRTECQFGPESAPEEESA
jgi:DNA polymerase III sliding clamp (beta) subunit (PCNA family)